MLSILRHRCAQTLVRQVQNQIARNTYTNIAYIRQISPVFLDTKHNLQCLRYKSKKSSKKQTTEVTETETEDETTWEDEVADKHSKVMQILVKSNRVDGILKSALGIARNKIETLFYESKIRVNGQKLLKKAAVVEVGDEVDVVKGVSVTNPNFLTVARVEILGITEKGENLAIKVRRCKSLTVENYEDVKSTE